MQQLANAMTARGHEVVFLVGFAGHGISGLPGRLKLKLGAADFFRDDVEGLKVYRCWDVAKTVGSFVEHLRPDVAVCFSGLPVPIAQAFKEVGVPAVLYFRNVEHDDFGGEPRGVADLNIANSRFTAEWLESRHGVIAEVLVPLVDPSRYATEPGDSVTFINPHVDKGRDIVFALAKALPHIPFLIVRAWTLDEESEAQLASLQDSCANVTVMQPTTDMKSVYAQTRIVLAPSQWQEAWGRIATEAHFSGIPVIASDIGGLPEAVGPGGVLVRPDAPVDEWRKALEDMWSDVTFYRELSDGAKRYSGRKEINSDYILDRFEKLLSAIIV